MALRNNTSDLLVKTSLPILILTGDQDILISPAQSQHMHLLAKNSQLQQLERWESFEMVLRYAHLCSNQLKSAAEAHFSNFTSMQLLPGKYCSINGLGFCL